MHYVSDNIGIIFQQTKSGRSEMEYFDKEVSRMIQEVVIFSCHP